MIFPNSNLNNDETIYCNHNNFTCTFPGCESKKVEYYTTIWLNKHKHILIFHWCNKHVPDESTYILQDDDSWWNKK
jgi:hypothetical protein